MKSIFSIRLLLSIILFTVIVFPLFKPRQAFACTCVPSPDNLFPISYFNYDVIFTGKVINGDPVHFNIYRAFKGVSGNEITIYTSPSATSCGYPFEVGKEYVVYGSKTDYGIRTGLCTGTTELSNAKGSIITSVIIDIVLIAFGMALLFSLFLIVKLILIVKTKLMRGG